MTFKLNDYIKHVEYPKSEVPIRLDSQMHVDVVNAQKENYEYATKEEYNEYWEGG